MSSLLDHAQALRRLDLHSPPEVANYKAYLDMLVQSSCEWNLECSSCVRSMHESMVVAQILLAGGGGVQLSWKLDRPLTAVKDVIGI